MKLKEKEAGLVFLLAMLISSLVSGQNWINSTELKQGVNDSAMSKIVIDVNNIKWIGTRKGLYRIGNDSAVTLFDASNSPILFGSSIIESDKAGNIWVDNLSDVLKYDGTTWTTYNQNNSNFPGGQILSMKTAPNGVLWMSVRDAGLVSYSSGVFTTHTPSNSLMPTSNITRINVDSNNTVWALATDNYLIKYSITDVKIYEGVRGGKELSGLLDIGFNLDGNVLIGSYSKGLFILADDSFTNIKPNIDGNSIHSPVLDSSTLWFVTMGGNLIKYDGSTWTNYYANSGKETGYAWFQNLALDHYGNIWITTADKGLFILVDPSAVNISETIEKSKTTVTAFPNPFQNRLNVKFGKPLQADLNVTLIDITGKTVLTQRINASGKDIISVSTGELKPGNYVLRLNNGIETTEILVTK